MSHDLVLRTEEHVLELLQFSLIQFGFFALIGNEDFFHVVNGVLGAQANGDLDHLAQLIEVLAVVDGRIRDGLDAFSSLVHLDLGQAIGR